MRDTVQYSSSVLQTPPQDPPTAHIWVHTLNNSCRKFSSSNSRNFLRQSLQKSGKKILPFFSTSHCMSTTSCSVGDNPRDFMAASRSSTFQNDQSSFLWEYDQLVILLFPFWLKPWEISREYYYISSNNVSYNPHYPHGQNWPGLVPFLQWVKNYETPRNHFRFIST